MGFLPFSPKNVVKVSNLGKIAIKEVSYLMAQITSPQGLQGNMSERVVSLLQEYFIQSHNVFLP